MIMWATLFLMGWPEEMPREEGSLLVLEARPYIRFDRTKDDLVELIGHGYAIGWGYIDWNDTLSMIAKGWVGLSRGYNPEIIVASELQTPSPLYIGFGLEFVWELPWKALRVGVRLPLGIQTGNLWWEWATGVQTYVSLTSPGYYLYTSISLQYFRW